MCGSQDFDNRKLRELCYKGDIKAYLVSFKTINRHARVNGTSLKELINLALPADIISLRFTLNRGPIHNDHDFLLPTEEAGCHYEELKRTLKMRTHLEGDRKITYFGDDEEDDKKQRTDRRGGKSGRKDKAREERKEERKRSHNSGRKEDRKEKEEREGFSNGAISEKLSPVSIKAKSTRIKQHAEKTVVGGVA